jgi:hypothetical protein
MHAITSALLQLTRLEGITKRKGAKPYLNQHELLRNMLDSGTRIRKSHALRRTHTHHHVGLMPPLCVYVCVRARARGVRGARVCKIMSKVVGRPNPVAGTSRPHTHTHTHNITTLP